MCKAPTIVASVVLVARVAKAQSWKGLEEGSVSTPIGLIKFALYIALGTCIQPVDFLIGNDT